MRKIELEVIRINEDVIATSCNSVWGLGYFRYKSGAYDYEGIKNGSTIPDDIIPGKFVYDQSEQPFTGYDGDGYYHVSSDGTIIEKCKYFSDSPKSSGKAWKAHNIVSTE